LTHHPNASTHSAQASRVSVLLLDLKSKGGKFMAHSKGKQKREVKKPKKDKKK
jgi:hypothetical protein